MSHTVEGLRRAHKYACGDPSCPQFICRAEDRCLHPNKKPCGYCLERFCPNDGCDQHHIENCREAMRP